MQKNTVVAGSIGKRTSASSELVSQSQHTLRTKATGNTETDADYSTNPKKSSVVCQGNIKQTNIVSVGQEVMTVRFSDDGAILAAGLSDGKVKLISPDTGNCLYTLNTSDEASVKPCTAVQFLDLSNYNHKKDSKNLLVAANIKGQVQFWHYPSQSCISTIKAGQVLALDVHGNQLVTAGAESYLSLYDAVSKKLQRTFRAGDDHQKMDGHRDRIFAVKFHPTERHVLISGGWDDSIQFWDDRQKNAIRHISGPHICGDALDIDPVHNHILAGSWRKDNNLSIYDFPTGEKIKDVPQDPSFPCMLYCAQWLGREYILTAGSQMNMARVIDRGTLNPVGQYIDFPNGVYAADQDRSSQVPRLALSTADKIYISNVVKKL